MENKVCLYIGTHNKTGLKYFGKSEEWFTEQELQKEYYGSGKYWKRHLKKHGDDVTMEIYGIYKKSEVEEIALKFSENNNIVKALNESGERKGKKVWANLQPENGKDGAPKGNIISKEQKIKISKTMKKFYEINGTEHVKYVRTEEFKQNMSEQKKGTICSEETRKLISEKGKGRKVTKETREKIGNIHKGKMVSEETRLKISKSKKGVKLSTEHKESLAKNKKGMLGLSHSEETKKKMSEKAKGRKNPHSETAKANMRKPKGPQEQVVCPHCGKEGGISNMKRWHFEKCKQNLKKEN
jgi:hypothetical protein